MNPSTMKILKGVAAVVVVILAISVSFSIYEFVTLKEPLKEVYEENEELREILVDVSYGGSFNTNILVFNLKKINKPAELAPFLFFVKFAEKMHNRNRDFDKVLIQYKGKTRFMIDGLKFSGLGVNAQIKTLGQLALELPPELRKPNGMPAFERAYGDSQWVVQKNLKNFEEFMFEWYVNDWISRAKKKGKDFDLDVEFPVEPEQAETPGDKGEPGEIPEIDIEPDSTVSPEDTPTEVIPSIEPEEV